MCSETTDQARCGRPLWQRHRAEELCTSRSKIAYIGVPRLIGLAPSAISLGMMESARGGRLCTFMIRPFARFANREGIPDGVLCDAVRRAGRGSTDADLGGGVIKQRIARKGQGRSGGFRAIVLFRRGERSFFRLRIREERLGQSSAGRVESVPSAGGRDARNGRGCFACGAFERDDSRGDLR